jgi:hypothetical protein
VAAIHVGSTDVFVYVKVDNVGTVDFGTCACGPVPAAWPVAVFFPAGNFLMNPNATVTQTQGGVTFTARASSNAAGDTLSGAVSFSFGVNSSGRRTWAWSPDGHLFAYVGSSSGNDWTLTIVALQDLTRSDGTIVARGQAAVSGGTGASGVFAGPPYWTNQQFGWAGSKAVIAAGAYAGGGGIVRSVACPEAPGNNTWGELVPDFPGQIGWTHLSSPCGSVVALVARILQAGAGQRDIVLISTATAQTTSFRRNNAPATVATVGANPSITTQQHAANGVRINTGSGATTDVDDPDCTLAGGGVTVHVDRVKASTLPSANLGVLPVGTAVQGLLRTGQSAWTQVPPPQGWANQSEPHWCLLAQAYTSDLTTVPRLWNGQAANPPAFPIGQQNCAQRNIEILP